MTLAELSEQYAASAALLRGRIRLLQATLRTTEDEEQRRRLQRRIADLRPLLYECIHVQRLCAHYYEGSFHRDEHYTL